MNEENNNNDNNKNNQKKLDVVFIITLLIMVFSISMFNFIVDPYFIFRDSYIKGFNNVKTHKFTNKRTIIYSDLKINNKKIKTAFVGNCLIARYGYGRNDIAFYTIPVANVDEVYKVVKNISEIAPHIKKIYWGLFFQDLWYEPNDEVMDKLPETDNTKLTLNDFINLFFSWNTTKYSIETVIDSIKNKGKDIIYIYPYKEIAVKSYENGFTFENMKYIKEAIDLAKEKGIEVNMYYSPIHISKKVHIYEKNAWERNCEFKRRLAEITPFYDYSLNNEYNMFPLDENSKYYIDNIHPTDILNNLIIKDLLSENKKIATVITKDNVEEYIKEDTGELIKFINSNKDLANKIKNLKKEDAGIKILKK